MAQASAVRDIGSCKTSLNCFALSSLFLNSIPLESSTSLAANISQFNLTASAIASDGLESIFTKVQSGNLRFIKAK